MRGVVFLGDRKLEIRELPDHVPGPSQVVIAMKGSGVTRDVGVEGLEGDGSVALTSTRSQVSRPWVHPACK